MFEKWEKLKAELAVRLAWIGWGSLLVLAVLFFFLNLQTVSLDLIFVSTNKFPGAVVYAAIFLAGFSFGKVYRYAAVKVNAIQVKYRERLAAMQPEGPAAASGVTSPASAPVPSVPLYAQTASGATAAPAAEPPKPAAETPADPPKSPEQAK